MTQNQPSKIRLTGIENIPDTAYRAFILLTLILVWKGVWSLGVVNWDDPEYVLNNPYFQNPGNILFGFYMGNYHPLTLFSLYLDSIFFGTAYSKWHISSLVLHGINALLLYQIMRTLGAEKGLSFLTTLVWSVLPVHAESIAWLSARKDLLYTGFGLGSVGLMLLYANSEFRRHVLYWGALILFLMACLAKAMAVSIALWMPVLLYPYFHKKGREKIIFTLFPFILISILTGIIAIMAQDSAGAIDTVNRSHAALLISVESMGLLISHIVYPLELSPIYPYPDVLPGYGTFILVVTIVPTLVLGYKIPWTRPLLAGMLMFFACILPVSQLLPVGSAITADRYAYAATAGLLIGCAGFQRISNNYVYFLLLAIIPFMAWKSTQQLKVWKNGVEVFGQVTRLYPKAAFAWNNLGNAYAETGRLSEAKDAFHSSVAVDRTYVPGLLNLAVVLRESGQENKALDLYRSVPESHNLYPKAAILALQIQSGKNPEVHHLHAAARLFKAFPNHPEVWYVSGNIFQNAKRHAEAIECYTQSLNFQPEFRDAILNRALSYTETGQIQIAIETFEKLLPDYTQPGIIYANWAWALYKSRQYPEAIEKAEQSVRILPGIPQLWFNYGLMAAKAGQDSLASSAYAKGMQLSPDTAGWTQAKQDLQDAGIQADRFLKQ